MSKLIVNGHGTKFRVTSKSNKRGTSNFGLITGKGVKKVEVKEDVEINFNNNDAA